MGEDDAFCVAIVAVFAPINGSMMPFVDWMDRLAIRAYPNIRMSTSMLLYL